MSVYLIAGRLGSGKSLSAVGRIRDALRAGRRVATNLNIDLEALGFGTKRVDLVRLPDKPTGDELKALGQGNESYDESKNGLLVLDELASWLNARSWGDKQRQGVLDFFIHSRKLGWDVYLIAQSLGQLDKQVRDALVEYHVVCRRLDRLNVPFVAGLVRALSFGKLSGHLPRVHIGFVRYGTDRDSILVERWVYRGNELFKGYDTRQRFMDREIAEKIGTGPEPNYGIVLGPYSHWLPGWVPVSSSPRAKRDPRLARVLPLLEKLPPEERWRHARRLASLSGPFVAS